MMILAIIQARMNSTRLKGKVLMPLVDKPVIEHIINRVKCSQYINDVVVATTTSSQDDALVSFLEGKVKLFRGDEEDVLDRFFQCAQTYKADIIVRITADDPLKDPKVIDLVIKNLLDDPSLDYCSNTMVPSFPEGLDVEVFRFGALHKAFHEAGLKSEREHVTPYIWKNPGTFKIKNIGYQEDLSAWRWTLDNEDDLRFMQAIYGQFYKGSSYFPSDDVIGYIKKNPSLLLINNKTARNEGYLNSIKKEQF